MPKFRVGDIVIGLGGNKDYTITGKGWTGKVHIINSSTGNIYVSKYEYDSGHWVDPQYFKLQERLSKLDMQKYRKIEMALKAKKPKTKTNHIGVELEFVSCLDREELTALIADNDLEKYVQVKEDGSIEESEEYSFGHEIAILAPQKSIYGIVRKVCALLRRNSEVNKSCGLHVHLDMRGRNVKRCYDKLFVSQSLLYSMVPVSRANNSFSCPETRYNPIASGRDGSRYVGINRMSYHKHKTIEVRLHNGTLNSAKINNWIKLLLSIINGKIPREREFYRSMDEFKKNVKMPKSIENYVKKRIAEFPTKKFKFAA